MLRTRPTALLHGQSRLALQPPARCLSAVAGDGDHTPPLEDLKRRSKELTGVEGTPDWPKRSGA
eukprot:COSAG02_NODE_34364_length_485_cov_0.844560_1_plen_63_part_10